jgi:hypothetical protein
LTRLPHKEIVRPKGTVSDCVTRDASDQITDGDFAAVNYPLRPPTGVMSVPVAVRELARSRVHLRRGWVW